MGADAVFKKPAPSSQVYSASTFYQVQELFIELDHQTGDRDGRRLSIYQCNKLNRALQMKDSLALTENVTLRSMEAEQITAACIPGPPFSFSDAEGDAGCRKLWWTTLVLSILEMHSPIQQMSSLYT